MPIAEKIRFVCFSAVLPLAFVFLAVIPRRYAMITKSIPEYSHELTVACLISFLIVGAMNWRFFSEDDSARKVLFASYIFSAFWITTSISNCYTGFYQKSIFKYGQSYNRVVNIDGVTRQEHRGSISYYANVNPNNLPNFESRIPIDNDLFDQASSVISADASKPDKRSACLIRVMVDRSGSAERIRWSRMYARSEIVSCSGPMS